MLRLSGIKIVLFAKNSDKRGGLYRLFFDILAGEVLMKVLFYGSVLGYTDGRKSYEDNDCSSVRELVKKLGEHFGEHFKNFLLGEETCFFLINGTGLMMTGGLDTKLQTGDKVEVLPFTEAG
jgi:molybdopterin converting factor small subunit